MHFSIPETGESTGTGGGAVFTVYHLHINGAHHATLRYSQLCTFHEELKSHFKNKQLPNFPPKKFLGLSPSQVDDRRCQLEVYIQLLNQDPEISRSELFINFFLRAQQMTMKQKSQPVHLIVHIGKERVSLEIQVTDNSQAVLEKVALHQKLPYEYVNYFALFMMKHDINPAYQLVRQLQDVEAPYMSLHTACKDQEHYIMLRKRYWDPELDLQLDQNKVALNLLYAQTVSDLERYHCQASVMQHKNLSDLKNDKKEYLDYARANLRLYGHVEFEWCICDYPKPNTRVLISVSSRQMNVKLELVIGRYKEASFKVARMKCWRLTTKFEDDLLNDNNGQLDLAFQYLLNGDQLRWVTINSNQSILLSMCLQSLVEELIMKRQKGTYRRLKPLRETPHIDRVLSACAGVTVSTGPVAELENTRDTPPVEDDQPKKPQTKELTKSASMVVAGNNGNKDLDAAEKRQKLRQAIKKDPEDTEHVLVIKTLGALKETKKPQAKREIQPQAKREIQPQAEREIQPQAMANKEVKDAEVIQSSLKCNEKMKTGQENSSKLDVQVKKEIQANGEIQPKLNDNAKKVTKANDKIQPKLEVQAKKKIQEKGKRKLPKCNPKSINDVWEIRVWGKRQVWRKDVNVKSEIKPQAEKKVKPQDKDIELQLRNIVMRDAMRESQENGESDAMKDSLAKEFIKKEIMEFREGVAGLRRDNVIKPYERVRDYKPPSSYHPRRLFLPVPMDMGYTPMTINRPTINWPLTRSVSSPPTRSLGLRTGPFRMPTHSITGARRVPHPPDDDLSNENGIGDDDL